MDVSKEPMGKVSAAVHDMVEKLYTEGFNGRDIEMALRIAVAHEFKDEKRLEA